MKKSNADTILEAIQDLHAQEQIVTRETLQEITGLKMTVIDDRVAYLVDEGKVHRVQRGVFVPAPNHPPERLMSKTILPDGTVKIEIGDDHVLTLTPRESRKLGELTAGAGQQFAAIELGHQAAIMASELFGQIKQVRRELTSLQGTLSGDQTEQAAPALASPAVSPLASPAASPLDAKKEKVMLRQKALKQARQKRYKRNLKKKSSGTSSTSLASPAASPLASPETHPIA